MSDYKIVQDSNKDKLTELVNILLVEDYILIGGLTVNYISTQYGVETVYTQAMAWK